MTDVDLAIRLTADATDAANAMDEVGDASRRMASDVDTATRSADDAASRMDGMADASDNVASKGAQAAGALSGLGELVGGPYGAAMQAGGVATQAMADAGDLLNVVTESAIVRKIKDTAVTIAQKTAQLATAAATRTAAAAQWAWNAAMSANPIGLVIAAVALLVGGFILLYKRSQTFRNIVQAVMRAASAAVKALWGVLKAVGTFVVKVLVGYFKVYRAVAVAVFQAVRAVVSTVIGKVVAIVQGARERITNAWQTIKSVAVRVFNDIRSSIADKLAAIRQLAADVQRKFGEVWEGIKSKGIDVMGKLTAPIQAIVDLVEKVIEKIKDIKLPDIDVPLLGAGFNRGAPTPAGVTTSTGGMVVNINVTAGVGDPLAIAAEVDKVVRRRFRYTGGA